MSTRRDLIYRMSADPAAFKKGMREAGEDSKLFYKQLKELEKQQKAVDEVMTTSGTAMVGFGVAAGAGLALAAKAAIDWESAWTGVVKVVDGSPEQLDALEGQLRDLATVLPQTHEEIAGVAAAAGQLGIARQDIAQFTEVMVAMGVSTDLASEDAAMGMARLMNIMQTAPDDVGRLGSAIVGLGNAGASTESEIMEMALRIAGAGETVGLTEAEVLGFSSALASVGIEAESGGSSISTAMIKISEAVNEGGDSLDTFAQVAGMTSEEFSTAFKHRPAEAIDAFVQGLGRMQASGQDVFATLDTLGLSEIRLRDALLRLAGAGDLLTESLRTGSEAWDENTALMAEAERRYGTTEAQMQIARNRLVDFGISIGEILLPAINDFLEGASGLIDIFNSMPDGLKTAVVVLGTVATAVGVVGGAALVAVPKIHAFRQAVSEMSGPVASKAKSALAGFASFLTGGWGAAIAIGIGFLAKFAFEQGQSENEVRELSNSLDDQTGAVTSNTRAWIANKLEEEGAFDLAKKLGVSQSELVDAVINGTDAFSSNREQLSRWIDELNSSDTMVGSLTDSQKEQQNALGELDVIMDDLGGTYDDATARAENLREGISGGTEAAQDFSAETVVMGQTLGITSEAASVASDAFDELDQRVRALIDSAFALSGAQRDVEAGIDDLTEKLEENGATIDAGTEKGRENQQAIEDQVAAIAQLAVTTAEQTGSAEEANAVLEEQTEALRQVLRAAGLTEEQIDSYIGVLDSVPAEIETAVRTSGVTKAQNAIEAMRRQLDAIDRTVTISFEYENFRSINGIAIPRRDGGIVGYATGGIPGYPNGGMFHGVGGPRDDANIVAISNGEFIVNAASTSRHRALLEAINSGQMPTVNRVAPSPVRAPASTPGEVKVSFDFSNISDSMGRAIKEAVRIEGNGNVQVAFGTERR